MFKDTSSPVPENLRVEARKIAARMFGLGPETSGPMAAGDHVGPYRITKLLGAGGQAFVYEAVHETLGNAVAVKIPRKDVAERLLKEARITARLDHPGIVRVQDVGEHEGDNGSVPYLVMELLDGGSLDHRLEQAPEGLPLDEVKRVGIAVLESLAYAHSKGVVHRDVKPSNVLFDTAGAPHLSDLGIGTLATNAPDLDHSIDMSQLTGDGAIGTPLYMAPEQENAALLHGKKIDGRADLFSFGKMLFLMLTGANPRTIRPVSRMRAGVSTGWDELIFSLVEEDREHRPAEAALALQTLRALPAPAPRVRTRVKIDSGELLAGAINVRERRDGESGPVAIPAATPEIEVPVATLVFPEKIPMGYLVAPGSGLAAWIFGLFSLASFLFSGYTMWFARHVSNYTDKELIPLGVGAILAAFFLRRCRWGEKRTTKSLGAFAALVLSILMTGWSPVLFASRYLGDSTFDLLHKQFIAAGWICSVGTLMLGVILLSIYRSRRRPPNDGPGGPGTGEGGGPVVRATPRGQGGVVFRVLGVLTGVMTLAGSAVLAFLAFLAVGLGVALNAAAEHAGWNVNLNLGPVGSVGGALAVVGVVLGLLITIPLAGGLIRGRRHSV